LEMVKMEHDMKKVILFIVTTSIAGLLSAQSLSLSNSGLDLSNDTLYIIGNTDDLLLESHVTLHNQTDKEVEIHAKKTELIIIENTENSFCWGACYPPFIFETSETVKVAANSSDDSSFIGDYSPDGNEGTSVIRYTFFVEGNIADSVSVVVFYQVGAAGVFDWTIEANYFKVYPNPTSGRINIEFPGPVNQAVSVSVISITGQTLFQERFQFGQTSASIDLSDKPRGYYFIELKDQFGHVAHKKILKSN
jgi:hypothetical protein